MAETKSASCPLAASSPAPCAWPNGVKPANAGGLDRDARLRQQLEFDNVLEPCKMFEDLGYVTLRFDCRGAARARATGAI